MEIASQELRRTAVSLQQIEHLGVEDSSADDLRWTEAETLLIDIGGADPSGVFTTDVAPVCPGNRKTDQITTIEDRSERRDIREMGTQQVGVVENVDVTRLEPLHTDVVDHNLDGLFEIAQEDRKTRRLTQQPPHGVEEADATIFHLVDDRAMSGTDEGGVHLLGD